MVPNISVVYLFLDMCYESFECANGQFCQKLDGEFQGVCIVADIEDNDISTGMVKSKIWNISKENFIISLSNYISLDNWVLEICDNDDSPCKDGHYCEIPTGETKGVCVQISLDHIHTQTSKRINNVLDLLHLKL